MSGASVASRLMVACLVLFPAQRGAIVLMSNLERSVQQFVPLISRLRDATGLN